MKTNGEGLAINGKTWGRMLIRIELLFVSISLVGSAVSAQQRSAAPPSRAQVPTTRKQLSEEEYQKVLANSLSQTKATAGPVLKYSFAPAASPLEVLQKQKQAADLDATQMKLGVHPTSATMAQPTASGGMLGNTAKATRPVGVQKVQPPMMIQPGTVSRTSPAGTGRSTMISAVAPNVDTTVVTCAHDPTMRILNVSGEFHAATFTPTDAYNFYTIRGCSFGNAGPNNKVYIYDKKGFQGGFQIKFWSDDGISVVLDPKLSGFPDLDNLFLVVQRADGKEVEAPGYKFYAARQVVPLPSIPPGAIQLEHARYGFQAPVEAKVESPVTPGTKIPQDAVGRTIWVFRMDSRKFVSQQGDIFHLRGLFAPGWELASVQPFYYEEVSCPGVVTYKQKLGTANWDWSRDGTIHGTFAATTCSGYVPPLPPLCFSPFGCGYSDHTASAYALTIWVNGPRCTDPYSGRPNQACIQKVQQGQL